MLKSELWMKKKKIISMWWEIIEICIWWEINGLHHLPWPIYAMSINRLKKKPPVL